MCKLRWISIVLGVCLSVALAGNFALADIGGVKEVPASEVKAGQIIKKTVEITSPIYYSPDKWDEEGWQEKGGLRYLIDTSPLWREEGWPRGASEIGLLWMFAFTIDTFQYTYSEYRVKPVEWDRYRDKEKLMAALAAGTAPSCFPADWLGGLSTCVNKRVAADLTEYWEKWPLAKKLPERVRVESQRGGRYYAFPKYDGAWDSAIVYRWRWFKNAGIFNAEGEPAPPKDWTYLDFAKILQKLTNPKKKKWGTAIQIGQKGNFGTGNPYNYLWQYSFAVPRVLPDPSGKNTFVSGFDSKPSKELLQFIHDLVWKYKAVLYGTDVDYHTFRDSDTVCLGEYTGASWAARHAGVPFKWVEEREGIAKPYPMGEVARVAPLPKGPHGTRLNSITGAGFYWVINANQTKEQIQATFEWLNWYEFIYGRYLQNIFKNAQLPLFWKTLEKRLSALKEGKHPEVILPEGMRPGKLNAPTLVPIPGVKPWIEQMEINLPTSSIARKITMADPMAPSPIAYSLAITNEGSMMKLMGKATEEVIVNKDADIDAIAKKYADLISKGPLRYKDKTITKENFKNYWTAVMEFYRKNFPEYYEANTELWKRVKVW